MRVIGISPFDGTSAISIKRFIAQCDHDLIVLPGWNKNHPKKSDIQSILGKKSVLFMESHDDGWPFKARAVTRTGHKNIGRQVFATTPEASELDQLENQWPDRQIVIGKTSFSVALCGEIDAFYWKDGSPKSGKNLPFDHLINPTHTVRGHWNWLGAKLAAMSKGKTVLHLANNDRNHHRLSTDIRLYVDGQKKEPIRQENFAWIEYDT